MIIYTNKSKKNKLTNYDVLTQFLILKKTSTTSSDFFSYSRLFFYRCSCSSKTNHIQYR